MDDFKIVASPHHDFAITGAGNDLQIPLNRDFGRLQPQRNEQLLHAYRSVYSAGFTIDCDGK